MGHESVSQEPRWRRLPEERPKQILDAALAMFAEHGLACTRLDDIAKLAGLSKGTIYLYFPNKEELFREVIRQTVIAQIERGERDVASTSGAAGASLKQFMSGYWQFLRSPVFVALFRLVNAELHNFPDLAQFYAEEVIARGLRLICGVLERGMELGEFRRMDPLVAARMLTSTFIMHALWCTQRQFCTHVASKTDDAVFEELIQFYLYAMRPVDDGATIDLSR